MDELEQRAIAALLRVRMPEQGWHKGFRIFLVERLRTEPHSRLLTKQRADLWFLVWTYRRQIEDFGVKAHAEELVTGAKSLAF